MCTADGSCPFFTQRCRARHPRPVHTLPGEGAGDCRPHLQTKGRRASSLSISYVGLQATFLLPALDKPSPRRSVGSFLPRSDNKTSYCSQGAFIYESSSLCRVWFMKIYDTLQFTKELDNLCRCTLLFLPLYRVSGPPSPFLLHLHLIPFFPSLAIVKEEMCTGSILD